MKVYAVKGDYYYPEKVFATIEEAKNYAFEMIKYEERRFIEWHTKYGHKFKTKIKINGNVVMLSKYIYFSNCDKWKKNTFRRSIIEKEFIGQ